MAKKKRKNKIKQQTGVEHPAHPEHKQAQSDSVELLCTTAERRLVELTQIQASSVTPQMIQEIVNLYDQVAALGHPRASFSLGFMHEHGLLVKRDFVTAEAWYTKAIEHGEPAAARCRLWNLPELPHEDKRDAEDVRRESMIELGLKNPYWRLALRRLIQADQSKPLWDQLEEVADEEGADVKREEIVAPPPWENMSQREKMLALLAPTCEQDYVFCTALIQLFQVAYEADQFKMPVQRMSNADSMANLAQGLYAGLNRRNLAGLAREPQIEAEIIRLCELALVWGTQEEVCTVLALTYKMQGDLAQAQAYGERALEREELTGIHLLATLYEQRSVNGGTPKDAGKALACYQALVDRGASVGLLELGCVHLRCAINEQMPVFLLNHLSSKELYVGLVRAGQLDFQPNLKKGIKLLEQARTSGQSEALSFLGWYYTHVETHPQLRRQGVALLEQAIQLGELDPALMVLVNCYTFGRGVRQDRQKAKELVVQGVAAGLIAPESQKQIETVTFAHLNLAPPGRPHGEVRARLQARALRLDDPKVRAEVLTARGSSALFASSSGGAAPTTQQLVTQIASLAVAQARADAGEQVANDGRSPEASL